MKTLLALAVVMMSFMWLGNLIAGETAGAEIKLFQFKPKTIEVKSGTTVKWTNGDAIEHSVTAGMPGKPSNAFDSGFFTRDGTFEHTFAAPGTFTYFCKRHPNMTAKVVVTQ